MSKKRILVVDDDDAVLGYLKAKIGGQYDLISTNASQQVIRLAREQQPHLILCDLDMPKMNGGDVSAALFRDEELRHIPLLFLTGLVTPEEVKALEGEIGGRPAIPKKASLAELVTRIESMLGEE